LKHGNTDGKKVQKNHICVDPMAHTVKSSPTRQHEGKNHTLEEEAHWGSEDINQHGQG